MAYTVANIHPAVGQVKQTHYFRKYPATSCGAKHEDTIQKGGMSDFYGELSQRIDKSDIMLSNEFFL